MKKETFHCDYCHKTVSGPDNFYRLDAQIRMPAGRMGNPEETYTGKFCSLDCSAKFLSNEGQPLPTY